MAGSIKHVMDGTIYIGWSSLENRGDALEAVEEFAFVLLSTTTRVEREKAVAKYYACCRGELPWPEWWHPGFTAPDDVLPPQRRRNKTVAGEGAEE